MTIRPIIFSGPMVCALLAGTKTQTRRVLPLAKGVTVSSILLNGEHEDQPDGSSITRCARDQVKDPVYRRGDLLWVREAWRVGAWDYDSACNPHRFAIDYIADNYARTEWLYPEDLKLSNRLLSQSLDEIGVGDDVWPPGHSPLRTRPSIFMPRWASRMTLEVTDVRVQRVAAISPADAVAEGISGWCLRGCDDVGRMHACDEIRALDQFRSLWDGINAHRGHSWHANPWVVALTFKVHHRNVDQMGVAE